MMYRCKLILYDSGKTTHCNGFSNDWNPPITRKFPTGSLYLRIHNNIGAIKNNVN